MVYGRSPSLDTFWDEALNLGRVPASEAAIAAAQARLEVHLPTWLRTLYARYDGGAVQMARGQSLEQPDNWLTAEWLTSARAPAWQRGAVFLRAGACPRGLPR